MQITVNTLLAIKTVNANYDKHLEEYKLQLAGWQDQMKQYTQALSAWAQNVGHDSKRPQQPSKPQNFEKTYKRLLKMLDLHTKIDLTLDDREFDQIFLDKFGWKGTFAANSATYGGNLLSNDEEEDEF